MKQFYFPTRLLAQQFLCAVSFYFLCTTWVSAQACGCLDCPSPIPETFSTIQLRYEVTGLVNDDLSSAQCVESVQLRFQHNKVQNMEVELISPSFQVVKLMGDYLPFAGGLAGSSGSTWAVDFVQCFPNALANPDAGLGDMWDNADPGWNNIGVNYTGSYYPFGGQCLESFDQGSANGTWQVRITSYDLPPVFGPGTLMDVGITFCDPTGFDCCAANGGMLADAAAITICEGYESPELGVIAPTYGMGETPSSTNHGYTYLIIEGDALVGMSDDLDLRGFPPGDYRVQGLSYALSDAAVVANLVVDYPMYADFLGALQQGELGICGDLSENLLPLEILEEPEPVVRAVTICAGESYSIGNQRFNIPGEYTVRLVSTGVCDSLIDLRLTVLEPDTTIVQRSICSGQVLDFNGQTFSETGLYEFPMQSVATCDSLVVLDLAVTAAIVTDTMVRICPGEFFVFGTDTLRASGPYMRIIPGGSDCDRLINLDLEVQELAINFAPTEVFTCSTFSVSLDASGSSEGADLMYEWRGASTGVLGNTLRVNTTQPGEHYFRIEDVVSGCMVEDTVVVDVDQDFPTAEAGATVFLGCEESSDVRLDGGGSIGKGELFYEWTTPDLNRLFTQEIDATELGQYTLLITDLSNECTATDTVSIVESRKLPEVEAGEIDSLTCRETQVVLNENAQSIDHVIYTWTSATGNIIGNADSLAIAVGVAGLYVLTALDTTNQCMAMDSVQIEAVQEAPEVNAGVGFTLDCAVSDGRLNGSASETGANLDYRWTTVNGNIVTDAETTMPLVNGTGLYYLTIENRLTGCIAVDSVLVEQDDEQPIANAGVAAILTCQSDEVQLDGSASSTGGDFSYTWTTVDGNIISGADTPLPAVNAAGTYLLEVTDVARNCSAQSSVIVTEDRVLPRVELGVDSLLTCAKIAASLGTLALAGENYSYAWETTNGNFQSAMDAAIVAVNAGGVYRLVVTDLENGCVDSMELMVIEDRDLPLVDAGLEERLTCMETSVQLEGLVLDSLLLEWRNAAGVVLGNTALLDVSVAGQYFLEATNIETSCTNVDSVTVILDAAVPVAMIVGEDLLTCAEEELRLTAEVVENTTVTWQNAAGVELSMETDLLVQSAGVYYLEVLDTTNLCSSRDSIVIGEDVSVPMVSVEPVFVLDCRAENLQLEAEFGNGNSLDYTWRDAAGVEIGINEMPLVGAGTYVLTVENQETGCTNMASTMVEAVDAPNVTIMAVETRLSCLVDEISLEGSSTESVTYSWRDATGVLLAASGRVVVNEEGWYYLEVMDDETACMAMDSVLVEQDGTGLNGLELVVLQPDCLGRELGQLDVEAVYGGMPPYLVSLDGAPLEDRKQFRGLKPGNYTLGVEDINGCVLDTMVTISDVPELRLSVGEDQVVEFGDSTSFELVTNQGFSGLDVTISSTTKDTVLRILSSKAFVRPLQTSLYTVQVRDSLGCMATDELLVRVVREDLPFFVPTAFSPNGDGVNDFFGIAGANESVERIEKFQIFDRWGTLLFEAQDFFPKDTQSFWDGRLGGKTLHSGVYTFYLQFRYIDKKIEFVTGDVTLLR